MRLVTRKRHLAQAVTLCVVLPGEGHLLALEADQALIGNGHAVGVPGQIGEHLFRAAERRLAVDDP